VQTGSEALLDREAIALEAFAPDDSGFQGQVFIHGERWRAHSTTPIAEGAKVRIQSCEGLTFKVEADGQADPAATNEETKQ
jgi:membrane-bound serine protease (ClpP class)